MQKWLFRLITCLLLHSSTAVAQPLHIETYTPANGLLDTRVIKIFQDTRGLIYFLTWEGISIYDGQRFTNITDYKGNALGLVNDIIQWKNDTCYVFTFQSGVYKLFGNRLIKDTAFTILAEPNHVLKYKDEDWIITSNAGLFRWKDGVCRPLMTQPLDKSGKAIDYAAIKDNYLIYSESNGRKLKLFNLSDNKIQDSLVNKNISGIKQGDNDLIYIFSDGKWLLLNTESILKGKLQPAPLPFLSMVPAGFTVNNLFFAKNKIWLDDHKLGYILLDPETGGKEIYRHGTGLDAGAASIFTDKENNYWLVNFSKQVQKAFTTRLKNIYATTNSGTTALLIDEENNAYAQTGKQLVLLQQNKVVPPFTSEAAGNNLFIWQGQQWVFKTATSLQSSHGDIIDLKKNMSGESSFISSNRISFDKAGRLIICGNYLFVVEKNLVIHSVQLPYFTDNISVDDNNNYWAFNRGGDIHTYSIRENKLSQNKETFKAGNVGPRFSLHWNADTFCLGTRQHGIVWLSIKNGSLKELGRLNTSNGLSNNFASCLTKKGTTLLYAATEFGLDEIKITGTDTSIQNLSAANNLFLPFSYVVKNKEGEIFARSNDNQLWAITENVASKTDFIPSVLFTEITVNGKATDVRANSYSFNENNFRFTVSAPSFLNAGSIRYNFVLENESRKWQQHSAEYFFSINNLSPGNYKLNVTVSYPGKIYPDKNIIYTFIIHPPLWKRWWFISLCILVTGLIFWALIRAYYQRKLAAQKAETEKQQAVEKERNRISRDMHDDLGSGLTKIAILSEVAKKQLPEPIKVKEQLEKISVSSRELVDNLQDIIWVLNPKNDTLESLSAYIREYALKYFEPLAVKLNFNYPEQFSARHLSEEKRRNVYLTIKESLNNIAKHAWCDTVTITIEEQGHQFEIRIKDDGKGFNLEKVRQFANGLKNMENRINQAGGRFSIASTEGLGTELTITMTV